MEVYEKGIGKVSERQKKWLCENERVVLRGCVIAEVGDGCVTEEQFGEVKRGVIAEVGVVTGCMAAEQVCEAERGVDCGGRVGLRGRERCCYC